MSDFAVRANPSPLAAPARLWAAVDTEWRIVAGFIVAAAAICLVTGTQVSLGNAGRPLLAIPVLAAIMAAYRRWRPAPLMTGSVDTVLKLFSILLLGMLISFPAATLGAHFPYRDGLLIQADQALGFDRQAYVMVTASHAWLRVPLVMAYVAMAPQFFLIGLLLFFTGQHARRETFVVMTGFTLAVTMIVFIAVPALTPAGPWIPSIVHMRTAGTHAISFNDLTGIISFPSFHTISACLFIWGCWRTPYLRWPVLALNVALIAATPLCGQHYGVDVLAGIAVAALAIFLFARRQPAAPNRRWRRQIV